MQTEDNAIAGLYQHYKGNNYRLHSVVKHSETLELMVLYEALYNNPEGKFWVRPYNMFFSKVTVNGQEIDRFKKVS